MAQKTLIKTGVDAETTVVAANINFVLHSYRSIVFTSLIILAGLYILQQKTRMLLFGFKSRGANQIVLN